MFKYGNYKANAMALQMTAGTLAQHIKNITRLSDKVVRIEYFSEEENAYLVTKDDKIFGLHFCEQAEQGLGCLHLNQLAFISQKLGCELNYTNIKTSLVDYQKEILSLDKLEGDVGNLNTLFDLLPTVATKVTTVNTPTLQTTEVSSALANFYKDLSNTVRDWQEDWQEIQQYLLQQKVDTITINRVVELRKEICREVGIQSYHLYPAKPPTLFDGPEYVGRTLRHILNKRHLIFLGDAGCGKDTLINTLAWVFGYPRNLIAGSPDENKESLFAEPTFKNGESSYELSTFAKNVIGGGLINFAEFNALPDGLSMSLHSIFDENSTMSLPLGWGNAPAHRHFLMIASGNLGSAYKVKELSPAFKSRFAIIRFDQTKSFKDLLSMKSGLMDTVSLSQFENIYQALKELEVEGRALGASGLRGFIFAANYLFDCGNTREHMIEAIEDYILNQVTEEEDYFEARAAIRLAYPIFPKSQAEEDYEKMLSNSY